MADWDDDSPQLRANLHAVLDGAVASAAKRERITLAAIKRWHKATMHGLEVPSKASVGSFRGEPGLEGMPAWIGSRQGAPAELVAGETTAFIEKLQSAMEALDKLYPVDRELDRDGYLAATEMAGWAHAQWVRIHPFRNGNGRTARILANAILARYRLPPAVRLRPRPDGGYGSAGYQAMRGNAEPTIAVVRNLLREMGRDPP